MTQPFDEAPHGLNQPTGGDSVNPTVEPYPPGPAPTPAAQTPPAETPPYAGSAVPPLAASPATVQPATVQPATEGTAVVALVCAILSWLVIPVILAIVALFLARTAEREIERSGGAKSGAGLVTATRWIAWIHLLLAAMALAFLAAFVVGIAIAR